MADLPQTLSAALAGRYTLERDAHGGASLLGRGGMATVYLATDLKHQRKVALKVLRPELAAALGPERFLREITLTAGLHHPHILPLLDSGEAGRGTGEGPGMPGPYLYYVMPFVQGESLRDRLRREKQLPVEDALRITREVADALDYAHRQGIIHRDIKPENILLEEGHALVADFGIARAAAATDAQKLTETGLAIGTPGYMSPEQATATKELDGRSDIYSLGCVLYEMLVGEAPYTGPSAQVILARKLNEPLPRVTVAREAVPLAVEAAIAKALARTPADRHRTAGEFAQALASGTPPPSHTLVRAPGMRPGLRWMVGAGAVLLLALAVVLARSPWRGTRPALDDNLLAVAPFDVLAPGLELWHEGLVDILSAGLDGAGPLHTVSPTIVVRRWSGRVDAATAARLGEHTGARLVVFGRLVGSGADSVRATAAILDAASGKSLGEVEVRELATRVDRLADSLTLGLLRELGRTRPIGAARLVSLRSGSLPALKAFLQGEQYYRRTVWDSALASYQRAVELDSAFALAFRRIANVLGWQTTASDSLARAYLLRAGRLNRGLPIRDSLLVVADSLFAALYDREADQVWWAQVIRMTAVLNEAARRYPRDPEVWFHLGEAGFHWGLWVGVTRGEVMDAFARSVALDPAFAPAYLHLVPLALDLEGRQAARRWAAAYLALHPTDVEATAIGIVYQLLDSARPWPPEVTRQLDTVSDAALFEAWASIQAGVDPAEPEVRLARLFAAGAAGAGPSVGDSAFRARILSATLARRGRLREAYQVGGAGQPQLVADLAMVGGLPADTLRLHFRHELEAGGTSAPLGLGWWTSQGDTVSILTWLGQSESVTMDPKATPWRRDHAGYWARAARGYLALARSDTAAALREFLALPDSLCGTCYLPRLTTVRLLIDQGRHAESARLLRREITGQIEGSAIGQVLWELERARNAERTGDREAAIRGFRHVEAVWRSGDPVLRPVLDSVSAALGRL